MVARPGAAPGVSSSQARRIAVFLARDAEIGGLCGHCSRDLPLDRRLLFVAELTGRMNEWWVVSVTLRQWSAWTAALQAAHDLYVTNDPMNGCGGRIRTGDTRRMKPLPSRLATPRFGGRDAFPTRPENEVTMKRAQLSESASHSPDLSEKGPCLVLNQ